MNTSANDLIYDWNTLEPIALNLAIEFDDETLRDGLQSPSVCTPSIAAKLQILHLMHALGIHSADIGLPGAGAHVQKDVLRLAQEIVNEKLNIYPNCAARTLVSDIEPIVNISQKSGLMIEVAAFIGSSPIRQYAEDWDLERMLQHTEKAVRFSVEHNLDVMYVTEDTTRANPDTLRKLYQTAIEAGARRICLSDTVGHATPAGTRALVRFIRQLVQKTGEDIKIDWHGHNDRGLALINALAAVDAGVDRVHGTALGIGERVGNTAMDQLLVNLKLLGAINHDLSRLAEYCEMVSRACDVPIPANYPIVGEDAFRTGTGVHAAAIIKALKKKDDWLTDMVYSGVPASMVGRQQKIEVGPMSGISNVLAWLDNHGREAHESVVSAIFQAAKDAPRVLTDSEIESIIQRIKT